MTRREYELQQMLRASHSRLKAANRRSDELFVQLTEATRKIAILTAGDPGSSAYLDMKERAATLASTTQALVNRCGKFSKILGDAAKHSQAILDTASVDPHSGLRQ